MASAFYDFLNSGLWGQCPMKKFGWMLCCRAMCLCAAVTYLFATAPVQAQGEDARLRVGGAAFLTDLQRIVIQDWTAEAPEEMPYAFETFVTGKQAMAALFAGEVDLASAAGVPIVDRFLLEHRENVADDQRMVVLTSYSVLRNFMTLVARNDPSLEIPHDIAPHRIGVMKGTILEFVLDRELLVLGMDKHGIEIVNVHLSDASSALETGLVDAVAVPEPYTQQLLKDASGSFYAVESLPVHQSSAMLMTTRKTLREKRPQIERYLQEMIRAEQALSGDPDMMLDTAAQAFGMTRQQAQVAMRQYSYRTNLGQTTLAALQDIQAWRCRQRWESACYLSVATAVDPDVLSSVEAPRVWILGD